MITNYQNENGYLSFEKGEVIILGSRPAMGKTTLALNIAVEAARQGLRVNFISLEMSANVLVEKIMSSESEVEYHKIKTGHIDALEYQRLIEAKSSEISSRLNFCDPEIWMKNYNFWEYYFEKNENKYDFIVIDYLQLIPLKNMTTRHYEIENILMDIKFLASKYNIPILVLSQLSRKVEERQGYWPLMVDLRECGAIEEIADKILFLLRRDYYDPMDKPGEAILNLAKDKTGSSQVYKLNFRKEICQFINIRQIPFNKK